MGLCLACLAAAAALPGTLGQTIFTWGLLEEEEAGGSQGCATVVCMLLRGGRRGRQAFY